MISNSNSDATEQLNQINAMIDSGVDAILIDAVSPTTIKSAVEKAKAKGILVVIANDPAAYEDTICVCGDNYTWQKIQAMWLMEQIEGTKWADKVPIDLPIYNIAGDQDPVGEYGVGVYQVSNWLIQTGHTVTTKLYSGYRHEIHNYAEIKNEVEAGIIAFMDGILS